MLRARGAVPLLLGIVSACGSPPPSRAVDGADRSEAALAAIDDWHDPASGLPRVGVADDASRRPTARTKRAEATTLAIEHATLLTATGTRIAEGTIVLSGGHIVALGSAASVAIPAGARRVDGRGRFVTPGIIDTHSHMGVYPMPGVEANSDGNEMVSPFTASADAAYAYWAQDPAIVRALAGGVTAAEILPGSANIIGGRGVTVEMRTGKSAWDVAFPGAPRTLKMACGENPKGVYGGKGGPRTRMGLYALLRDKFLAAADYNAKLAAYEHEHAAWAKKKAKADEIDRAAKGDKGRTKAQAAPSPPTKTLEMEVLAAVLRGEILVQVHCYRQDDIAQMVAVADDVGFKIRSFHHALEAFKVRDDLVRRGIAINTWADWWGFKMEAFDGIPENAGLFTEAGGRAVIHSDSSYGIQRLNQEAGKAFAAAQAAGLTVTEDDALRWITANPAWVLGIDRVTGTLEVGKRGDVVLWSAHPFSVYARADLVLIDGAVAYDRAAGAAPTDFELGTSSVDGGAP